MAENFYSPIHKQRTGFDSPIFSEIVASYRMQKFEKMKKRPMFYEMMSGF